MLVSCRSEWVCNIDPVEVWIKKKSLLLIFPFSQLHLIPRLTNTQKDFFPNDFHSLFVSSYLDQGNVGVGVCACVWCVRVGVRVCVCGWRMSEKWQERERGRRRQWSVKKIAFWCSNPLSLSLWAFFCDSNSHPIPLLQFLPKRVKVCQKTNSIFFPIFQLEGNRNLLLPPNTFWAQWLRYFK